MAAGPRWTTVLVLTVTTLFGNGDGALSGDSLLRLCRLDPTDVSTAVSMECSFDGISTSQIRISSGELPASLQDIRITNANSLTIAENAFSHLRNLQSIYFGDIRRLVIAKNNWQQVAQPERVTITMERSFELHLQNSAFSVWSHPGPRIAIKNTNKCRISLGAFGINSTIQKVDLQNINTLSLNTNAFRADIDQLELRNISLDKCRIGSFRGRIRSLLLQSVRTHEVHSGCVQAFAGWNSLTIRSSDLGNIHRYGISGSVGDVVIEDSRLGRIDPHGLNLNTTTFTMKSTKVKELASDALDVLFKQSASLQTSSIDSLQENAFSRLESSASGTATLTIRRVTVEKAENGSLAFSNRTQVTKLNVVLREECACDADKQALRLMLGDALPRDATKEQLKTARQIVDQVRCTAGPQTPTLIEFHCRDCTDQGESTARCSAVLMSRAALVDWIWPVGVGTLLLLVLAGVAVMLVKKRRSRRRVERPGEPHDKDINDESHRKDGKDQDDDDEPIYCEIPDIIETVGMSEYIRPSLLQAEPGYYDVESPRLPRPPLSMFLEMTSFSAGSAGPSVTRRHGAEAVGDMVHMNGACATKKGQIVYANLHM